MIFSPENGEDARFVARKIVARVAGLEPETASFFEKRVCREETRLLA